MGKLFRAVESQGYCSLISRLLYAERQGDRPPSIVKTGATKSAYSHSKNLQAAAGQVQLWAIPITPAAQKRLSARDGGKAQLTSNSGHLRVQNVGGIVDKHHRHGGRSIGKALQSILPEIIDRPVRIRICLPVVFQRTQRLRRIQG